MTLRVKQPSVLPGFGLTLGYTIFYLSVIVLIPLSAMFLRAGSLGLSGLWEVVTAPRVLAAYKLTFGASLVGALINAFFGFIVAWQTFSRVTLPNVKWAVLYGVILCNARAMGEFGAVSVVSGHIRGKTNTIPLHVEILYNEYNFVAAFAVASLLAVLALLTLVAKTWVELRMRRTLKDGSNSTAMEG